MSTPLTMNKFIRWRVRDWVSCFLACRFPLEDESDKFRSSPPRLPIRNMVFEFKDGNMPTRKLSGRSNRRKERRGSSGHGSTQAHRKSSILVPMEGRSNECISCPCHQDEEDYIIFTFKEGGQFDIVNDDKLQELDCLDSTDTGPFHVSIKEIECVEDKEMDGESGNDEERLHTRGDDIWPTDEEEMDAVNEGREEEGRCLNAESPSSTKTSQQAEGEIESGGMGSVGSSDGSPKSEGSSGSFTFPVLPWELMGSPRQMPKPESLHLKRHKVARLQCCRF